MKAEASNWAGDSLPTIDTIRSKYFHKVSFSNFSAKMKMKNNEILPLKFFVNESDQETIWYLSIFPNGFGREKEGKVSFIVGIHQGSCPGKVVYNYSIVGKSGRLLKMGKDCKFEHEKTRWINSINHAYLIMHNNLANLRIFFFSNQGLECGASPRQNISVAL